MSLAADTREAVRARPFLLDALRAGVVNYAAAAAWLTSVAGLDGDEEAIAAALRRFRDDLPAYATADHSASVSMRSGVGVVDGPSAFPEDADVLLRVGTVAVIDEGDNTAFLVTGDVGARALAAVLDALVAVDVSVAAAGVAGDTLLVVVSRRDGATALRTVEAALKRVPTDTMA
jgi:hypothetical protein